MCDRVILLVGLENHEACLSVTFVTDVQCTPNSVVEFSPTVRFLQFARFVRLPSHFLNFDVLTFLLVFCFTLVWKTVVLGGH